MAIEPITAAMVTRVNNAQEATPHYSGTAVATDWGGGAIGNDVDTATATRPVTSAYLPTTQASKASLMVPPGQLTADVGKDYGPYTGGASRTGTVEPFDPYPVAPVGP